MSTTVQEPDTPNDSVESTEAYFDQHRNVVYAEQVEDTSEYEKWHVKLSVKVYDRSVFMRDDIRLCTLWIERRKETADPNHTSRPLFERLLRRFLIRHYDALTAEVLVKK